MPKSKGRRHQEKKKSGISPAVKTETLEAVKANSLAMSSTASTKRIEAQSYNPYLKKELVRTAIVAAVTLLALIIIAVAFK